MGRVPITRLEQRPTKPVAILGKSKRETELKGTGGTGNTAWMSRMAVTDRAVDQTLPLTWSFFRAEDGIRTRDPNLGKVAVSV
jgi:hypothetical protein